MFLLSVCLVLMTCIQQAYADEPVDAAIASVVIALPLRDEVVIWDVDVKIDGIPVNERWDAAIRKTFEFADVDDDQHLTDEELARLPSPFALRQILWGRFVYTTGHAPKLQTLDSDGDGQADVKELGKYYRANGIGGVVVALGESPYGQELTAALIGEGSKKLTQADWNLRIAEFAKQDRDGDGLIAASELLPRISYPGSSATQFLSLQKQFPIPNSESGDVSPLVLANKAAAKVKGIRIAVLMDINDAVEPTKGDIQSCSAQWRVAPGTLAEMWKQFQRSLELQFSQLADSEDRVAVSKLEALTRSTDLSLVATVANRDGDDQFSRTEMQRWLEMLQVCVDAQVMLSVMDYQNGLFEYIDADRSGTLSKPELETTWKRFEQAGLVDADAVQLDRLPRQLQFTLSHGKPQTQFVKHATGGPPWFTAMDRNGDGQLSAEEFLSDPSKFRELDSNGDGVISAREVTVDSEGKGR